METKAYKNSWFLVINGIIAILFGLLLLLFTKEFILSAVSILGLALITGGLCFLFVAIYNLRKGRNVGLLILQSIFSIAIGLVIMIFKEDSLSLFFILLGVWAIIVGLFQLIILVNVKRNLSNKNIILFNGLLTIALGIVLIIEKNEIPILLTKVLGGFAVLFGLVMIYLSIIIHKTAMITDEEPGTSVK
jgi:uncharacterized membrane protein HdeD (DUF308 family)